MHNDSSQESLIRKLMEEPLENPLVFEHQEYDLAEWDNVPSIVPRYCINLSKQMEALVVHYSNRCEEQSTESLKQELLGNIGAVLDKLDLERADRGKEEFNLQVLIQKEREEQLAFWKELNKKRAQEFALATEDVAFLMNQRLTFLRQKDPYNDQFKAHIQEDFENSYRNYFFLDQQSLLNNPRVFSISQIKDLFFHFLTHSDLVNRFAKHQAQVELQFQTKDRELEKIRYDIGEILLHQRNFLEQLDQLRLNQKNYQTEQAKITEKIHNNLAEDDTKFKKLFKESQEHFGFRSHIQSKNEQLGHRINQVNERVNTQLELFRSFMQTTIKETDEKLEKNFKETSDAFNEQKVYSQQKLEDFQNQINDQNNQHTTDLSQNHEKNRQNIIKAFTDYEKRTVDKVNQVKDICTEKFLNFEDQILKFKELVKNFSEEFRAWDTQQRQPNALNQATLFSLERRMADEEATRMSDIKHIKIILENTLLSVKEYAIARKINPPLQSQIKEEELLRLKEEKLNERHVVPLVSQIEGNSKIEPKEKQSKLMITELNLDEMPSQGGEFQSTDQVNLMNQYTSNKKERSVGKFRFDVEQKQRMTSLHSKSALSNKLSESLPEMPKMVSGKNQRLREMQKELLNTKFVASMMEESEKKAESDELFLKRVSYLKAKVKQHKLEEDAVEESERKNVMKVLKRSALDLMSETGYRASERKQRRALKTQTQPSSPLKPLQKHLGQTQEAIPLTLLAEAKYVSNKDMERAEKALLDEKLKRNKALKL